MKKIYLIILIMTVISCSAFSQQLTLPDERAKITVNGEAVVYGGIVQVGGVGAMAAIWP